MPSHTEKERKKKRLQSREPLQSFPRLSTPAPSRASPEEQARRQQSQLDVAGRSTREANRRGITETSLRRERQDARFESQETKRLQRDVAQDRRAGFQEQTGSAELAGQLGEQIVTPNVIERPDPSKSLAATGQTELLGGAETLRDSLVKGALPAALIVGGLIAGVVATPFIVAQVARIAIPKLALGTGSGARAIKTAVAGLGIFVVGKGVFDIRGDEMEVLRGGLTKVVEDGERIEATNRNGFDAAATIALLRTMADEVTDAEKRLQELGIHNLQYRVSNEFRLDVQNVRSARLALLRRIIAVENIAATGQAAFNPEELLFNIEQMQAAA